MRIVWLPYLTICFVHSTNCRTKLQGWFTLNLLESQPYICATCSLILSVTGGAQTFDLPLGLYQEVKRGIIQAALSKNAWIIDGGTNVGVMKLVR